MKVTLFEHTRKELAIVFDDFKPVRLTPPEKDVTDMTKGEYKKDEANRKGEQQLIKEGYKRVATKYKNLKAAFSKDVTEKLRSGSGKITAEHWQSCWYLWKGTPSTEPIDFGISTTEDDLNLENMQNKPSLAMEIQVGMTGISQSTGISLESCLETNKDFLHSSKRKASQVSATKQFVDTKREK